MPQRPNLLQLIVWRQNMSNSSKSMPFILDVSGTNIYNNSIFLRNSYIQQQQQLKTLKRNSAINQQTLHQQQQQQQLKHLSDI